MLSSCLHRSELPCPRPPAVVDSDFGWTFLLSSLLSGSTTAERQPALRGPAGLGPGQPHSVQCPHLAQDVNLEHGPEGPCQMLPAGRHRAHEAHRVLCPARLLGMGLPGLS